MSKVKLDEHGYPVLTNSQLIDGSLKKWRGILDGKDLYKEQGHIDCPLCQVYWESPNVPDVNQLPFVSRVASRCTGCPIRTATGQPLCIGTPYAAWIHAADNITGDRKYALYEGYEDIPKWDDELEAAAKDMIDFLLDLQRDYPE